MITAARWVLVALLVGHGLLHLLGTAKGLGLAEVSSLTRPIGAGAGVLWLVAALLVSGAAGLLALGPPTWWWFPALLAAVVSQVAIATSWSDARAGTAVNVVLLLAAAYGLASEGPRSFHAQYRSEVESALAEVEPSPATLREADLTDLPAPLAAYVRRSGAVGHPRTTSVRVNLHGRIRSSPDEAWMPFTAEQVNTFGPSPRRIFLMDATRSGLPVTVLHEFADASATMRVRLLSLIAVADASGPAMDRGETVTLFNDLVVLAPGAIVDAPVTWEAVDGRHIRGTCTVGEESVSATLVLDAEHDLVDFVSDDRSRASADGRTFTPSRWSTPLTGHRDVDGRRVPTRGEGVWHAAAPQGTFAYIALEVDSIRYDEQGASPARAAPGDRGGRAPAAAWPPTSRCSCSRRSRPPGTCGGAPRTTRSTRPVPVRTCVGSRGLTGPVGGSTSPETRGAGTDSDEPLAGGPRASS